MNKEQLKTKLADIYERLTNTAFAQLEQEDVQFLLGYYGTGLCGIPYEVLKGRTATLEEWFLERWEN